MFFHILVEGLSDVPTVREIMCRHVGVAEGPLADLKTAAADRWCSAMNAQGGYGRWHFKLVRKTDEIRGLLDHCPG